MLNETAVAVLEQTSAAEPEKRIRDRSATERAILKAAKNLLAEEGFPEFRHQCGRPPRRLRQATDLPLLRRSRWSRRGDRRRSRQLGQGSHPRRYRRHVPFDLWRPDGAAGLLFLEALRDDPLMRRIVAWEVSENTEQVRRLSEARSKALGQWLDRMRGSLAPPKGVDAAAVNAHDVCRHPASGAFCCRRRSVRGPGVEERQGLGKGGNSAEAPGSRRLRLSQQIPQAPLRPLTLTIGLRCLVPVNSPVWSTVEMLTSVDPSLMGTRIRQNRVASRGDDVFRCAGAGYRRACAGTQPDGIVGWVVSFELPSARSRRRDRMKWFLIFWAGPSFSWRAGTGFPITT